MAPEGPSRASRTLLRPSRASREPKVGPKMLQMTSKCLKIGVGGILMQFGDFGFSSISEISEIFLSNGQCINKFMREVIVKLFIPRLKVL